MPLRPQTEIPLLFDAILDQVRLLDERCEDPVLTSFILAIGALAKRGFEEAWRAGNQRIHNHGHHINDC